MSTINEKIPLTEVEFLKEIQQDLIESNNAFDLMLFSNTPYSLFCKLHSVLQINTSDHTCLGCNLNSILMFAKKQIQHASSHSNVNHIYMDIFLALYLVVERIDTVFNLISLDKDYRDLNFKALTTIRKWSNFIKHPKAFILVHHPHFTFVGCKYNPHIRGQFKTIIDHPFILKFYSNDEKNEELLKALLKNDSVLVVFPNLLTLFNQFIHEMLEFNEMINSNKIYREKLSNLSTFHDYWLNTIKT